MKGMKVSSMVASVDELEIFAKKRIKTKRAIMFKIGKDNTDKQENLSVYQKDSFVVITDDFGVIVYAEINRTAGQYLPGLINAFDKTINKGRC